MKTKNLLIIALAACIFTSISVLGSNKNPLLSTGDCGIENNTDTQADSLDPRQNCGLSPNDSREKEIGTLDKKIIPIIDTEIGSILGGAAVTPTSFYLVGAKETYEYIKDKTDGITLNSFAPVADYENQLKIKGFSEAGENCENFYGVTLDKPVKGILIGTSGNWQPDSPKPQDLWKRQAGKYWQNQTYKSATADFLKTKGIRNPKVQIVEAKKIDFDGDGTDEVIINAAYFKNKTNPFELNAGDYHVVFVRKIVNGKVKNILIEGQFGNGKDAGAVMEHDIYAILDLEGDGNMEIILHSKVPEGRWSKVFHLEGNGFVEVLRTGCSA